MEDWEKRQRESDQFITAMFVSILGAPLAVGIICGLIEWLS